MKNLFETAKANSNSPTPRARVKKTPPSPKLDENGMSKSALKKQRKAERMKEEEAAQRERDYQIQVERTNHLKKLKDLIQSNAAKLNPRYKDMNVCEDIGHLLNNVPELIKKLQSVKNATIETEPDGFNDNYEASYVNVRLVHTREETDIEWGERLLSYEMIWLEAEAEKLEKKRKAEENKIKAEVKRLEKIRKLEEELSVLKSKK